MTPEADTLLAQVTPKSLMFKPSSSNGRCEAETAPMPTPADRRRPRLFHDAGARRQALRARPASDATNGADARPSTRGMSASLMCDPAAVDDQQMANDETRPFRAEKKHGGAKLVCSSHATDGE